MQAKTAPSATRHLDELSSALAPNNHQICSSFGGHLSVLNRQKGTVTTRQNRSAAGRLSRFEGLVSTVANCKGLQPRYLYCRMRAVLSSLDTFHDNPLCTMSPSCRRIHYPVVHNLTIKELFSGTVRGAVESMRSSDIGTATQHSGTSLHCKYDKLWRKRLVPAFFLESSSWHPSRDFEPKSKAVVVGCS